MEKTAVERLRDGEKIVGTMVRLIRNSAVAHLAKFAELDFFMLDMEHGAFSIENAEDIAKQARALNVGIFARVPELARGYVSRLLDAGVEGIMVPMISSVEEAEKLVSWGKYPPVGNRGFSSNGPITGYQGMSMGAQEFMDSENRRNLAIAQIETAEAIACIDGIASVEGIDVLLVGPNDLAISLGYPGNAMDPHVQEAIGKVADAAEKAGKVFAIHAGDKVLAPWKERMPMVMNSIDIDIIGAGMADIKKRYK